MNQDLDSTVTPAIVLKTIEYDAWQLLAQTIHAPDFCKILKEKCFPGLTCEVAKEKIPLVLSLAASIVDASPNINNHVAHLYFVAEDYRSALLYWNQARTQFLTRKKCFLMDTVDSNLWEVHLNAVQAITYFFSPDYNNIDGKLYIDYAKKAYQLNPDYTLSIISIISYNFSELVKSDVNRSNILLDQNKILLSKLESTNWNRINPFTIINPFNTFDISMIEIIYKELQKLAEIYQKKMNTSNQEKEDENIYECSSQNRDNVSILSDVEEKKEENDSEEEEVVNDNEDDETNDNEEDSVLENDKQDIIETLGTLENSPRNFTHQVASPTNSILPDPKWNGETNKAVPSVLLQGNVQESILLLESVQPHIDHLISAYLTAQQKILDLQQESHGSINIQAKYNQLLKKVQLLSERLEEKNKENIQLQEKLEESNRLVKVIQFEINKSHNKRQRLDDI